MKSKRMIKNIVVFIASTIGFCFLAVLLSQLMSKEKCVANILVSEKEAVCVNDISSQFVLKKIFQPGQLIYSVMLTNDTEETKEIKVKAGESKYNVSLKPQHGGFNPAVESCVVSGNGTASFAVYIDVPRSELKDLDENIPLYLLDAETEDEITNVTLNIKNGENH